MKHLRLFKPKGEKGANKKNRQLKQLKYIVRHLSKSEDALSIPEIAEHVKISVPTGTKLVKELVEEGLVIEEGKKVTENGRKPAVYTIDKSKFYAVGVEVLSKWIHVSIVRIDLETVHEVAHRQFILEDTEECLNYIIGLIQGTIVDSPASIDNIIGVGIGLTGSVNGHTGKSADYFTNMERSLKKHMEDALGLPVMIDNDTRVIGTAEQVLGVAKGVENVLVIKVSRDLGLSIIIERHLIFGANGFAGNFGHIQYGTKGRLCTCGKKNCLRTEVSGNALFQDLKEALEAGEESIYFKLEEIESYSYHDILDAVLKGDALSIKLLMDQGDKLGQAIGSVINLLNPNMVVLGGEIVMVKEFILDAVKAGMRKTGLVSSLKACKLEASGLGRYFSSRGAACMVLKNYELINY
ncbi:MAG: transcriptional regulator of PTS gene [Nonlabens sp.]|jgi:transcriptional regulator of PTS gene